MIKCVLMLMAIGLSSTVMAQLTATTEEMDTSLRDVAIATKNASQLAGQWHGMAKSTSHKGWNADELEFDVMSYCISVPGASGTFDQIYYVYSYYNKTASKCYHSHSRMIGNPLHGQHKYFTSGTTWTEHIHIWQKIGDYDCRADFVCGDRNGADRYQSGGTPCPDDHIYYEVICRHPGDNVTKAITTGITQADIDTFLANGNAYLASNLKYIDADKWMANLEKDCSAKNEKILMESGYCQKYPVQLGANMVMEFGGPGPNCQDKYCMVVPPVPNTVMNFSSVTFAAWVYITQDDVDGNLFDISEPLESNVFRVNFFLKGDKHKLGVVLAEDRSYDAPNFRPGLWHHVAVTWSSSKGTMKIYVDGNLLYSTVNFHARPILMTKAIIHIGVDFGGSPDENECLSGAVVGAVGAVSDQPDEAVWPSSIIKQHSTGLDICAATGIAPPLFGCADSPHSIICSPLVTREAMKELIAEHMQHCQVGGVNSPLPVEELTGLVTGHVLSDIAGVYYGVAMSRFDDEEMAAMYQKYLVSKSCLGKKENTLVKFHASYNEQTKECMVKEPMTGSLTGNGLDMLFDLGSAGQRVLNTLTLDETTNCVLSYLCNRDPSMTGVCNNNMTYVTLQCKTPSIIEDVTQYFREIEHVALKHLCINVDNMGYTTGEEWASSGEKNCLEAVEEAARDSNLCRPKEEDDIINPLTGGSATGKASAESKAAAEGPGAAAQAGASAMSGRRKRFIGKSGMTARNINRVNRRPIKVNTA